MACTLLGDAGDCIRQSRNAASARETHYSGPQFEASRVLQGENPDWEPARRDGPASASCFHFSAHSSLSVSSMLRALAYSVSFNRAASQRSALVNSCVDTTAPLPAPPIKLTTIKTWIMLSSADCCCDPSDTQTCRASISRPPSYWHAITADRTSLGLCSRSRLLRASTVLSASRDQPLRPGDPVGGSSIQSRIADGEITRHVG